MYLSSQHALMDNRFAAKPAEHPVRDPYEDFEEGVGISPVKVFVVTEEMRRRDQVDRRKQEIDREASLTWKRPPKPPPSPEHV